jgi:hypothetical protein
MNLNGYTFNRNSRLSTVSTSNIIYLIEFRRYIKECVQFKKPIDFEIAKHLLYRYRGM